MPGHSFARFAITEDGDLFITGDWGDAAYSWRSFANQGSTDGFKAFLADLDKGYFNTKIGGSMIVAGGKKTFVTSRMLHIWPLFEALQTRFKQDLAWLKEIKEMP